MCYFCHGCSFEVETFWVSFNDLAAAVVVKLLKNCFFKHLAIALSLARDARRQHFSDPFTEAGVRIYLKHKQIPKKSLRKP